jgi:hypothetical protein
MSNQAAYFEVPPGGRFRSARRGRVAQRGGEVRGVAQTDCAQATRSNEAPEATVVALSPMYGKDRVERPLTFASGGLFCR